MKKVRKKFWEKYELEDLSLEEWELLCDRCGRCCLIKIDNGEYRPVTYTKIACKLFDNKSCKCTKYSKRKEFVKDCVTLSTDSLKKCYSWMPSTCAYKLLTDGEKLRSWHHLISGSYETVHEEGISVRDSTISEKDLTVS